MKNLSIYSSVVLGTLSLTNPLSAQAQESAGHHHPTEEIVVKAHPLFKDGLAQAITVLTGDELAAKTQNSIGATIAGEAGIRSASFGAAVGRPVIHGLGAARVKVTEDRIDSLDVSVTSTDHAVTVEPFIADQITILKGASTLIYGSGAIGGVVDVQTGRIPTELTGEPLSGRVELRASDNADGENAAFRLDGETKNGFAWHVDGYSKKADEYDIPGFVRSSQLREQEAALVAQALANGEAVEVEEEARDELGGSELDIQGGSVGLSYVFDRGFVGVSVGRIDGDYGLVGPGEEEEEEEGGEAGEEEEGTGRIDLEQTRVDVEAELRFESSVFEKVNLRFGINDYEHSEIEGSGELGTFFENDAWEGRIELTHAPVYGFDGVVGLQFNARDFSAVGEEAFVAPVDSDTQAIFWVGERHFDRIDIETGLRFEQVDYDPTGVSEEGVAFEDNSFSTFSASVGGVFQLNEAWRFSALLDYSERAPTIEELFSDGAHLATQSFELGDPDLNEESVVGLTFTGQYEVGALSLSATVYALEFDDFIFQANTGDVDDGFPVLAYSQEDSTFVGIDFKAKLGLGQIAQGDFSVNALFDIVDAELDVSGNDNIPRIPADRFGLGFDWASEQWDVAVNYVHVTSQDDTAEFELASSSYNDVSVRVSRAFTIGDDELDVFIQGRNLTDDDQRNHVSFVKDFAPAPGRTFEVGARFSF